MPETLLFDKPTAEQTALLNRAGSLNRDEAIAAARDMAVAFTDVLRKGVLAGSNIEGIFNVIPLAPGATPEFPLDILAPGTEKEFVAYTIPKHGRIPERTGEGDYVTVPTYSIASSIDWLLRFARDSRWDIVGRYMQILEASFVKKKNDDGWHTLLAAGVDRNIVVYDGDASAGQFTKRLVSLGKTVMRRNGGGNSTSINRGMLTDMYTSPENVEDIRDWKVDQVDEITRREIFTAADGQINRIFGVNLHDIDELGEDQEYQLYFTNVLGGVCASGDVELSVGLDLRNTDSFVMPVRSQLELFEDPALHRSQKQGYYGWEELGFGSLDGRRIILLTN